MKKHRRSYMVWLFLLWLLLSGCGQANSQNERFTTPLPEPSQIVSTFTAAAPTVAASNDCKKIAFVLNRETTSDIYSVCPDGTQLTNLTNDTWYDSNPSWSPDGSKIAFTSSRNGDSQIYVMDEDGSNPIRLTSDYENGFPVWLPNGEQIAFQTTDAKGLWWWRILDLESNRISQFTEPSYDFFYQTPAWSPDGQYIAYMSLVEQEQRNDGSSQIHIKKVDGSNDIALTNDIWANINPVWSPDGSKIAFLSERDGTYYLFALYVMAKDGTNIQRLTEPVYSDRTTLSWSPDGQQIAMSSDMDIGQIYIIDIKGGDLRELLYLRDGEKAAMPSWQP